MCALLKFIKVFCIVLHILTTLLIHCFEHSILVCITQTFQFSAQYNVVASCEQ